MRRILIAALAALLGTSPAFAADNYSATAGSGLTFAAKNVGGVLYPWWIPSDSTGAAFGVTGNPFFITAASGAIVSGADVTEGTTAETTVYAGSGGCTVVACLKGLYAGITGSVPAGSNTIGAVTQASGPWTSNVTQFGGNNVATGTGAGGAGIPRVTMSNDSSLAANQSVNTSQVNGVTVLTGTGATGTGAQRVTVSTDQATNAGAALVKGGVGVVNGGSFYQAVAASQTATVLQSSTGAIGDYLSHCTIYPTSTSPGVVTVFDNTNAAGTSAILFPGGASSLSNLVPFTIPVGAVSVSGAWKVTTGTAVSVVCYGKFS